jgi:carbamoyl-phosphate synthase large subunit
MGGQTALNTALKLDAAGVLTKYGCELIGAKAEVIDKAEDRQKFRDAMSKIGIESPKSAIAHSMAEAHAALEQVGLPCVIRPSFTLGGTGGGIAYNREEFEQIVSAGLAASMTTEVLVEESVLGWKEFEMEVVRDRADNCIIVCSIENLDPMGVHTGDSVTIAPALTLTDKEYQIMRDASIACLREIGVDTGGSNVQFGINPADGRMVIIEMNPRVSRSSALASKATGFPIAKVAAKLAVGYTLDELTNDITRVTPASFEPTIDYVVVKIPRFTFEKFPGTPATLTTSMKSVGETMAIGRSFAEALQKGLRGLETGLSGLDEIPLPGDGSHAAIRASLATPKPDRALVVAQAIRAGMGVEEIHEACKFDPWFIREIERIVRAEEEVRAKGLPARADRAAPAQGARPLGPAPRRARRHDGGRCPVAARAARRAAGLQAHRHLRRRVRLRHALHVLDLRGGFGRRTARARRPTGRRSSSSAAARTASARASSSTIAASTPPMRCARPASRRSWSTATRDGQHRLRHLRPLYFEPLTMRTSSPGPQGAGARRGAGLHRAVWRPDAAQALPGAAQGGHPDPRHQSAEASTSPRTASASSSC